MGFESILVSFHGYTGTLEQLVRDLDRLIPTTPNPGAAMTSNSSCWVLNDGQHTFEVEAGPNVSEFSLRFALCNPCSIDPVFLWLTKTLRREQGLELHFREDCEEVPAWWTSPGMVDQSEAAILRCLAWRRQQWHQEFGTEELAATCAKAFERFILPRSRPLVFPNREA